MNRWTVRVWVVVAGVAWLPAGCATMFYGTTQEIPVTSVPDGAEVRIQGTVVGKTPVTLTLDRKPDYELRISKPGYESATVRLKSVPKHDGTSLALGGVVGWGIDSSTGGNKSLYPEAAHAVLELQSSPVAQAPQQELPRADPAKISAIEPGRTALEEHLARLDSLRARRIITEDEHALMRRRLLETAGPADLIGAGPAARESTSPGTARSGSTAEASWFTGMWAAESPGHPRLHITSRSGSDVDWEYRVQVGGTLMWARGGGTVNGASISMTGSFEDGGQPVLAKRLVFELKRDGEALAGTGTGVREVPFTIRFTRAR